ncbi:MAG TPA: tRNA (N(6)-L-threonylcarbamoyladenosine(37)-C(2))-methylthiotransferase MtaB [Terriglobales bacterium]|nr:tRNA (N(6)-L-threonylcarbamoyladenosine(37)-C(2))-methylthiotransferase MtaB [Terriglobales bacterium]
MSSYYVQNFGCRAAQADGAAIEQQLRERGLKPAPVAGSAQVVVLNTCTVTASADKDVRAAIRRLQRENPDCKILVTGCYAQRAPQEVASIAGVNWVVGNSHKGKVGEIVCGTQELVSISGAGPAGGGRGTGSATAELFVGDIFAHTELLAAPVFEAAHERTRPNLKVQDGCNNRCSFCIIPSVRGRSRSLPLDAVLQQVNTLVAAGYRELVISGINLGQWGKDLDGFPQRRPFAALLRAVLELTALEKLRISSVEPMDWTEELIELVAGSPRIARHAHVPMQSGSDRVLRRMHRRYRPWHYAAKIRRIRQAMPTAAIGADVMVGFPGETDDDFEQTRRMIEELPFTYLHVFTYSSRPGTPSAEMPEQVPPAVMKERNRILRELAAEKKRAFLESFVGRELPAITLGAQKDGFTEALTDNYLPLWLRGEHQANRWIPAIVTAVSGDSLTGQCR